MDALSDAFSSLGLNIACVTESWYKGGTDLREGLVEFEDQTGIRVLHKSRDGRKKRAGGGVAIAFAMGTCNFKVRTLKHVAKDAEVLCVVGVIGKIARKIVTFVVYVPPPTTAPVWDATKEAVVVEVGAVLKAYKNPIVMVTGDFHHRDLCGALNEVSCFAALPTGPTRGANTIDIIYSNKPEAHTEAHVLPPLQADGGALSDHQCVYTEAEFLPERGYTWTVTMRRTRDAAREQAFADELRSRDWRPLIGSGDVNDMTAMLEEVVRDLT